MKPLAFFGNAIDRFWNSVATALARVLAMFANSFKSSENLIEKLNNLNQLKNDFGDLLEVLNNELQENSLLTLNKRISKYL